MYESIKSDEATDAIIKLRESDMTTYIALSGFKAPIGDDDPGEAQIEPELDIGDGEDAEDDEDCELDDQEAEGDEDDDGEDDDDDEEEDGEGKEDSDEADEANSAIPAVFFKQGGSDSVSEGGMSDEECTRRSKRRKVLNGRYAGPEWETY